MAFLSELRKLKWNFYQGSRVGPDTGVLTIYAKSSDKKAKQDFIVEMGWSIIHRLGDEDKKLIRNVKHKITHNFVVDQEPGGDNIDKFVDSLDWQPMVLKTLPEDVLRP